MEYGHNLAKDGTTSVKVHHQPGGASSFSLGHDDGSGATDDRFGHVKKGKDEKIDPAAMPVAGGATEALDAVKAGKGFVDLEEKKEEMMEEKKEQEPAGPAFTSVKYSGQPPGGKSSITF